MTPQQKWNKQNPEKLREATRRWRAANPEKSRIISNNWKKNNPAKHAAINMRRKAKLMSQTPDDADQNLITALYEKARKLSLETGVEHHVDHIIPLSRGGQHHQDNLQILTASENLHKGSKMPTVLENDEEVSQWLKM